MNSDLMPSPESSNLSQSNQPETSVETTANVPTVADTVSKSENLTIDPSETTNDGNLANRQQPIPPPSEPMQYRAIGLVRGRYIASEEQFTQGTLLTADGVELQAVLLGRIMSLVKNHLDLEKNHLWVVYPRTKQESDALHIQIVGVWEPENLAKQQAQDSAADESPTTNDAVTDKNDIKASSDIPDGGFSVRGEVVYQSFDDKNLVVKIKQAARKQDEKPKYFKLKLKGVLATKAVGKFWDFQAKRDGDQLAIETAEAIADLPKKRRPPLRGGGGGFRGGGGGGGRRPFPPRRNTGDSPSPRPVKRIGGEASPVSKPLPKSSAPAPKPIKKQKPPQES
ncbi:hypothetical protein H6G76_22365 [Nostoc sp. FACHB-152]|uniref:hypothetical protein n=1 Tax=unclassified Nostoc TaxID=2593658 RepID=UPI00168903EE|nr:MULTISPECIES: hypothetical protein [unclassified Nostoc]MBD2449858.1 hypothetical protein [Nostoc sp. FACHB-152]MBD2471834.1 hypothetical protein [Nostoc sp. FACHB-145]